MKRRATEDSEHPARTKKSKPGAPSSRDTTEQAEASTISKLLHRRMLIADIGFSDIRQLVGNLETISFQEIAATVEELQAGMVLLTGVAFHHNHRRTMKRYFPAYEMTWTRTDGSDFIALWHADTWKSNPRDRESWRTSQLPGSQYRAPACTCPCRWSRRVTTRKRWCNPVATDQVSSGYTGSGPSFRCTSAL